MVESHNARRQEPIALEEIWSTRRWENRVLDILLALSEVNNNLGECHFGGVEAVRSMLDFRGIIYMDLIKNPYLRQDYLTS